MSAGRHNPLPVRLPIATRPRERDVSCVASSVDDDRLRAARSAARMTPATSGDRKADCLCGANSCRRADPACRLVCICETIHDAGAEMPEITYDDFLKVDIRVGRIVHVDDFPKAKKPAYRLRIDFGALGVKRSSAQLVKHYQKADLLGKLVLAVVNFPPRQNADCFSEVLTLGVIVGEGEVVLVHPDRDVPLGALLR